VEQRRPLGRGGAIRRRGQVRTAGQRRRRGQERVAAVVAPNPCRVNVGGGSPRRRRESPLGDTGASASRRRSLDLGLEREARWGKTTGAGLYQIPA
jgi:hypothetical protein